LVVSGVLTVLLASSHGARGAAVATTLGEAAIVVVGAALLVRATEGLRLPFGVLLRVAAAAVPAFALALVPGLPTVVLVVLATAVYVGILLALRAIPPELLVELRRLRPRPAR
jgi:type III secretory pathway component EscU